MLGKPIFFTSDLHIGHAKAIEYDQRPFANLEEMHEALITRFNSTVPKNGLTYFLGDIGNKPREVKAVIEQLNGTKILILGNHDHGMGTMLNCGFDAAMWSSSIYIGEHRVTMSHCPLLGVFREDLSHINKVREGFSKDVNWHGENRKAHRACSLTNEGQFHLHGHIHSRKGAAKSKKILGRQYDVGVTANDYRPVSLSTITSWVMLTVQKELQDKAMSDMVAESERLGLYDKEYKDES